MMKLFYFLVLIVLMSIHEICPMGSPPQTPLDLALNYLNGILPLREKSNVALSDYMDLQKKLFDTREDSSSILMNFIKAVDPNFLEKLVAIEEIREQYRNAVSEEEKATATLKTLNYITEHWEKIKTLDFSNEDPVILLIELLRKLEAAEKKVQFRSSKDDIAEVKTRCTEAIAKKNQLQENYSASLDGFLKQLIFYVRVAYNNRDMEKQDDAKRNLVAHMKEHKEELNKLFSAIEVSE